MARNTNHPKCSESLCFANKCGTYCDILSELASYPCPFYKSQAEVDVGRMDAHSRLIKKGRVDLIEKYEYNAQRKGQW